VTVFEDDKEAEKIWLEEMKVDASRFSRCGAKDNFWQMGDTGPCGPCTEIFFDHGPEVAGGPPGSPEEDGDRYIEIWNLVFMQYERQANGDLIPLPKPSVDTGMGLERIADVLQGVHNNYDIDLFQHLIKAIAKISNANDLTAKSLRVIADHIRSCAFMIADGVRPSNEGRGYVLRRIMRRAIRHGNRLGISENFFYKLVKPLAEQMGEAYPELIEQGEIIEKVILKEEQQFAQTLENGLKILEEAIAAMTGKEIPGEVVFKLYDTYGFPEDLTADIARERELTIDKEGFERCMQEQRDRSKQGGQFNVDYTKALKTGVITTFVGYEDLQAEGRVEALYIGEQQREVLKQGERGLIILNETPFYAESGGQVGDKGELSNANAVFVVEDTQKIGQAFAHIGHVKHGELKQGEMVRANVNQELRQATRLNHSATHLLHAALHEIVGQHVVQKGSLVDENKLRFDFSHSQALTREELKRVERLVNYHIRANHMVETTISTPEEAKAAGVMALFGEKYGDKVRVLTMSEFSKELCGGTHVDRTGDIGLFKVLSETGTAAGVRRIEAVTGAKALEFVEHKEAELADAAVLLKAKAGFVPEKIQALQKQQRELQKQLQKVQQQLAQGGGSGGCLEDQAIELAGLKVLAARVDGIDANGLRASMDQLKNKLGSAAIVLASVSDAGKVQLCAGVTKDLIQKIKAGELVNYVAQQVGGKGGGRPDMAMAGGSQPENLDKALESVKAFLEGKLK
jgi:alanyl-tRNA synthetase